MRWRVPFFVALALCAIAGCDQQPIEPAAEQIAAVPTFNFMNNPDAGPKIVRHQESFGFWFEDIQGYLIVVGLEPADLCGDWQSVDFTSVFTPTDNPDDPWWWGRWIDNWQLKHAPASIYDYAGPFDCDVLQALGPLATGEGHAKGGDNDYFHWLAGAETGNNNANAWGWNLHASMGDFIFNVHVRCVWNHRRSECNVNGRLR